MRVAAFAMVLAACAGGPQARVATGPIISDMEVRAVIRRALEADAAYQAADSLYSTGATVVANGRTRLSPPRYAGIARGATLTIQTLAVEMSPTIAWGTVRYRAAEAGEATFVLRHEARGWLIVHAHSSQPMPTENNR